MATNQGENHIQFKGDDMEISNGSADGGIHKRFSVMEGDADSLYSEKPAQIRDSDYKTRQVRTTLFFCLASALVMQCVRYLVRR
jgi:hypothetical protein